MCELCSIRETQPTLDDTLSYGLTMHPQDGQLIHIIEEAVPDMARQIGTIPANVIALKAVINSLGPTTFDRLVTLAKDYYLAMAAWDKVRPGGLDSSFYEAKRDFELQRVKLSAFIFDESGYMTFNVKQMTEPTASSTEHRLSEIIDDAFNYYSDGVRKVAVASGWNHFLHMTCLKFLAGSVKFQFIEATNRNVYSWRTPAIKDFWDRTNTYCARCGEGRHRPLTKSCTSCVITGLTKVHAGCCPHTTCLTCNRAFSGEPWGPRSECVTCAQQHTNCCTRCGIGRVSRREPSGHVWCQRVLNDRGFSSHCRSCCNCPRGIPRKQYDLHKFKPSTKEMRRNKLSRLLGVEIEVVGVEDDTPEFKAARAKWRPRVMDDGSLGGGTSFEMPTQPAGGDIWLDMVHELCEGLKASKAYVTEAAGLHVHVDCQDLNAWDLQRVFQNFITVEDAIYDMIHPARKRNHFCKPSRAMLEDLMAGGGRRPKMAMEDKFYNLSAHLRGLAGKDRAEQRSTVLKRVTGNKYMEKRYYGLNVHSFWHRGTLEFRHHHGTVNPAVIANWGMVVGSLVSFSAAGRTCKPGMEGLQEMATAMTGRDELADWIKQRTAKMQQLIGTTSYTSKSLEWI